MTKNNCSILSIAPYVFLPPKNGGHQAIAQLHHHLGLICTDNIISTVNNGVNNFSFNLHKVFPNKSIRYRPWFALQNIINLAKEHKCTHIICEHPYMSFTAIAASKKLGIPWYCRSHNIEAQRFKSLGKFWWPILAAYEKYAMHKSDGVFFITKEDAEWAARHYDVPKDKCHVIPFGTNLNGIPKQLEDRKENLSTVYNISKDKPWLYFLGALDYKPNEDAVEYIINEIAPRLVAENIDVEILIAGKGLTPALVNKIQSSVQLHHIGFVEDLHEFLTACDIMLNPVLTGGGIKTKAIEALGNNNTVISSTSGAAGIDPTVCGDKLLISEDHDWSSFVKNIRFAINKPCNTPNSFYDEYYQGNIAKKVLSIIN